MLPSFIFITILFYVSNVSTEVSKQEFQNIMLHSLNDARKELQDKAKSMPPLIWDTTLANDAERFAKKCYPTKKVDESHRHFGQTSALVFSYNLKSNEVRRVAKRLLDEKDFAKNDGSMKSACHHKCLLNNQVITANTRKVGCGFANCNEKSQGYLVRCFYNPRGNLFNTYPSELKKGN